MKHNIKWSGLDWTLGDTQLAKQLGVDRSLVGYHRKRLNLGPSPVPQGRQPQYDWSRADWSRSNYAVAKQLGCSAGAAAYNRLKAKVKTKEFFDRIKPKQDTKTVTLKNLRDRKTGEPVKIELTSNIRMDQGDLLVLERRAKEADFLAKCLEESLRLFVTPSAYPKDNPALFSEMAACEVRARHALSK